MRALPAHAALAVVEDDDRERVPVRTRRRIAHRAGGPDGEVVGLETVAQFLGHLFVEHIGLDRALTSGLVRGVSCCRPFWSARARVTRVEQR